MSLCCCCRGEYQEAIDEGTNGSTRRNTNLPPQSQAMQREPIHPDDLQAVQSWRERVERPSSPYLLSAPQPNNSTVTPSIHKNLPSSNNHTTNNKDLQLSNTHLSMEAAQVWKKGGGEQEEEPKPSQSVLELQVSLRQERPGPDRGEEQPAGEHSLNSSILPSLDESSIVTPRSFDKTTIEPMDQSEELDAIVQAVQERQRSRTPSPSPTSPHRWSPTIAPALFVDSTKNTITASTSSPSKGTSYDSTPDRTDQKPLKTTQPKLSPLNALRATPNVLEDETSAAVASKQQLPRSSSSSSSSGSTRTKRRMMESSSSGACGGGDSSSSSSNLRERYLVASRLLQSRRMQRKTALHSNEYDFLQNLLLTKTQNNTPSLHQVEALEQAAETLETHPLFRTECTDSGGDSSNNHNNQRTMTTAQSNKERQRRKLFAAFLTPPNTQLDDNNETHPFLLLGMESITPTVMTPVLVEALRGFFPTALAHQNLWLKFSSLQPRGSSLPSLLSTIRASQHTLVGVETKEGQVFGVFCSTPWRLQRSWFGSGNDAFVWRLKKSRCTTPNSAVRNYDADNEMEVYPYTGHDDLIQYVSKRTLAVGGGDWDASETSPYPGEPTGIGFTIDGDLLGGETNSCATFANPRLCGRTSKKNEFEIESLEVWAITPCRSVNEAQQLELRCLFGQESSR